MAIINILLILFIILQISLHIFFELKFINSKHKRNYTVILSIFVKL